MHFATFVIIASSRAARFLYNIFPMEGVKEHLFFFFFWGGGKDVVVVVVVVIFFFDLAQDGYGREDLSFLFPTLRKQKIRKIWPRYLPESITSGCLSGVCG